MNPLKAGVLSAPPPSNTHIWDQAIPILKEIQRLVSPVRGSALRTNKKTRQKQPAGGKKKNLNQIKPK